MKLSVLIAALAGATVSTAFPFMAELMKDGILNARGDVDTPELINKLKDVFGDTVFDKDQVATLNQQFQDAVAYLQGVPAPTPEFLNTPRDQLTDAVGYEAYVAGREHEIWPPTDMRPYRQFPPSFTSGPFAPSPAHGHDHGKHRHGHDRAPEFKLPTVKREYDPVTGWGPAEDDDHPWFPPTHGQTRGPCPGLNAAANHGYLPRSGIVTPLELMVGMWESFSLSPDMATFLGTVAFVFQGDPKQMTLSIGTDKDIYGRPMNYSGTGIGVHGVFEGDGSVTRQDHGLGTVWPLDKKLYRQFLKEQEDGVTIKSLSASRHRAWQNTVRNNEVGDFNPWRMIVAYVESGFSHEALRGDSEVFSPQMVESWFYYERFPPGWQRRKVAITLGEMLAWGARIWEASPAPTADARPMPGWAVHRRWVPLTTLGSIADFWAIFTTGGATNTVDDIGCAFKSLLFDKPLFAFLRKLLTGLDPGGYRGIKC